MQISNGSATLTAGGAFERTFDRENVLAGLCLIGLKELNVGNIQRDGEQRLLGHDQTLSHASTEPPWCHRRSDSAIRYLGASTAKPEEPDNVYVGILSSKELRRLYAQYGDALFYENVRNFLSPRNREVSDSGTSINEEIIKTVKHNPEQFLARNNGIVIKAQEATKVDNRTLRLRESSVVNGCQTTMCIVGYTNPDNEVMVMAKVVGTDQAWDVARAANLQNDVTRFELEIAQFLRPQLVNKAASHEGYRVVGNDSAFSLLDSIYSYEIMYEDLRSLFVGIFSTSPNNIFGTSYLDLLPELIGQFYTKDPDGTQLLNKLFQIQQAASRSMQRLQERMQEKGITISAYQRFFRAHPETMNFERGV